jgi:hypothetical protein
MPDDAIERARRIGIQVAANFRSGWNAAVAKFAVESGACAGLWLAFASQQAPEGSSVEYRAS